MNGRDFASSTRGFNIVVVDGETGKSMHIKHFINKIVGTNANAEGVKLIELRGGGWRYVGGRWMWRRGQ